MGTCYSHKAADRRYTYTTVQMASTKLDDSSRLARPTPYTRGPSAPFPTRKGIPVAKPDHLNNSPHLNLFGSSQSTSQLPVQSSIPRFSSVTKQEINENFIYSSRSKKSENSTLNLINNNTSCSSPNSTSGLVTNRPVTKSPVIFEGNISKVSANSKSCSDSLIMNRSVKTTERQSIGKSIPRLSPHGLSGQRSFLPLVVSKPDVNMCSLASPEPDFENTSFESNAVTSKHEKTVDSGGSLQMEMCNSKSSSCVQQSDSHDSITDLDSGLGGSLAERFKQDDGDTLKDLERLDSAEILSQLQFSPAENKSSGNLNSKSSNKPVLKCPRYRRSLNGKWVREDSPTEFQKNVTPKKYSFDKGSYNTSIPKYGCETFSQVKSLSQQTSLLKNDNSLKMNKLLESQESSFANAANTASSVSSLSKSSCSSLQKSSSISNHSNDEKSDDFGSETKSPTSEIENRDFLIDDEISDQPNLISVTREKEIVERPALSLQQSVTELHALSNAVKVDQPKMRDRLGSDHRDSVLLCSELGSSCSSIGSDDMMLDYEKRNDFPDGTVNEGLASPLRKLSDIEIVEDQLSELGFEKLKSHEIEDKARKRLQRRYSGSSAAGATGKEERRSRSVSCPLRPPRPMSVSEAEGGSVILDSSSYRLLSQDLNGVKTLLLRLKGVIQEADTISPFDQNFLYRSFMYNETSSGSSVVSDYKNEGKSEDNSVTADLRRQVALLQQQLEEKNRTIHLLQQQMTKYANLPNSDPGDGKYTNASTQTESQSSLTSSISSSINDDGSMETLVSLQETFEGHMEKNLKEQSNIFNKEVGVSRSLNSLCQDPCFSSKESASQSRSLSSAELYS